MRVDIKYYCLHIKKKKLILLLPVVVESMYSNLFFKMLFNGSLARCSLCFTILVSNFLENITPNAELDLRRYFASLCEISFRPFFSFFKLKCCFYCSSFVLIHLVSDYSYSGSRGAPTDVPHQQRSHQV